MSRIQKEYAEATDEQRVRFCANVIEDYSLRGKSARKISDDLKKVGATEETIREAYERLEEEDLPTEREKAGMAVRKMISQVKREREFTNHDSDDEEEFRLTQKEIRRIMSRLAYMKFDGDILYEILDEIGGKW